MHLAFPNTALTTTMLVLIVVIVARERDGKRNKTKTKKKNRNNFEGKRNNRTLGTRTEKEGRNYAGGHDALLGNPLNRFDEEITDSQTVAESLSQLLMHHTATRVTGRKPKTNQKSKQNQSIYR